MNELVTQQRAAEIALKSQRAELIDIRRDALTYPRIKDYDSFVLLQEIKSLILMVYQYRGQKPESAAEIETMARSLVAEILADEFGDELKELTIEEVRRSLRRAALGKGNEMYGINVRSLYDAIADYRHSDVERAASQLRQERDNKQREGYMTREAVVQAHAAMMEQAAKERMI